MNVDQLIHIWANQSKPSGTSGNVFFEGPVLYSYGYHYPVGVIIEHKGKTCALINKASSSVTTNSHVSNALSATSHLNQFEVLFDGHGLSSASHPAFKESWLSESMVKKTMEMYSEDLKALQVKLVRSRLRHEQYEAMIAILINCANSFLETFREFAPKGMRKLKTRSNKDIKALLEKAKEAKKKELEKKRADFEESLAKWKKGETGPLLYRHGFPVHLRVWTRLNEAPIIQTSHGAEVHYDQALELYQKAMRFRNNPNLATRIAGSKVGHFTVTSMDSKGIKIGCHFITWDVIDEFAKEQGWTTEEKASA